MVFAKSVNVSRFLEENFTNADGVLGLCYRHLDTAPRREAAQKWFLRGGIPSEWWPRLLLALEQEQGGPVSLAPYVASGGGNGIFG